MYKKEHLSKNNMSRFESFLKDKKNHSSIVLFCVESDAKACHRSLLAEKIFHSNPNLVIKNL